MLISIIIRTYNEARYLDELLTKIGEQDKDGIETETIIVDSGSTDRTVEIAEGHGCRIIKVAKEEFSFGRSLNIGSDAAAGERLVFISGHCLPVNKDWLKRLIAPLSEAQYALSYGRQIGSGDSKFSEHRLLKKYFPQESRIPQEGFFCSNANLAIKRSVWSEYRFDEELTGLEDMDMGKRIVKAGMKICYVAEAPVFHCHNESWARIKKRYERESIALQHIMPEIHIGFFDFTRYFLSAVLLDSGEAIQQKTFWHTLPRIVLFRLMQFWGSYSGNHIHRELSKRKKESYFYPK